MLWVNILQQKIKTNSFVVVVSFIKFHNLESYFHIDHARKLDLRYRVSKLMIESHRRGGLMLSELVS